jgi:hypothetical protein
MPTVLQRISGLTAIPETQARWRAAFRWARDRTADHLIHTRLPGGRVTTEPLFQDSTYEDAAQLDDAALVEFLDRMNHALEQYRAFV